MQTKYNISQLVQNLFSEEIQSKRTMLKLNSEDSLVNLLYNDYICFLESAIKSYIVLYLIANLNEKLGNPKKANYYKESLGNIEIPEFYTKGERFMPNLDGLISELKNYKPSDNIKNACDYLEFFMYSKQQINLENNNNNSNSDNIFTLLIDFYKLIPEQANEINSGMKNTIKRTLDIFETYYAPLICSYKKDRC